MLQVYKNKMMEEQLVKQVFVCLFVCLSYMVGTDRRRPNRLLRSLYCPGFSFIHSRIGAPNGSTGQSTHTSVLCDETPGHQSRSQA